MADEFRHKDVVAGRITEDEYENINQHIFNNQATGDLAHASSPTQISRLGIGNTGELLQVLGGIPSWVSLFTFIATRAHTLWVPIASDADLAAGGGWTAVTGGVGSAATINFGRLRVRTNSDIGHATWYRDLGHSLYMGNYRGVNWDKELYIQFTLLRGTAGAGANAVEGYVQLKLVNTKGALAAKGLGVRILGTDGLDIRGESYDTALGTADFDANLFSLASITVGIHHRPGVSVDFYVNGTLQTNNITTANQVPSGQSDNNAVLVESLETTDDPVNDIKLDAVDFFIIQAF